MEEETSWVKELMDRGSLTFHSDRHTLCRGEKRLLAAVLVRAARDALAPCSDVSRIEKKTAIEFLSLDLSRPFLHWSKENIGFTFAYICEQLGLCPFEVHKRLKTLVGSNLKSSISNRYIVEHAEYWIPDGA